MGQSHLQPKSQKSDVNSLAYSRTLYAFERTALSYFRTSITFLIASITLVKLFDNTWVQIAGILLLPMVVYLFIVGLLKYRELNKLLD